MSIHFKKLNQRGFDHVVIGLALVVVLVIGGTYYALSGNASAKASTTKKTTTTSSKTTTTTTTKTSTPWSGALALGSATSGYCMDEGGANVAGTKLVLNACNNAVDQKWELNTDGTANYLGKPQTAYTIQNYASGTAECVTSSSTGLTVQLSACNGGNPQKYLWVDNQLKSVQNTLCIEDSNASMTANNPLQSYACQVLSNELWFETANTATAAS